jgi:hypothetical protein
LTLSTQALRAYAAWVEAFLFSAILLCLGAIPVLPVFLSRARMSPDPTTRALARGVAFVLLWLCFMLSWSQVLVVAYILLDAISAGLGALATMLFIGVAASFSHRVAFSD